MGGHGVGGGGGGHGVGGGEGGGNGQQLLWATSTDQPVAGS